MPYLIQRHVSDITFLLDSGQCAWFTFKFQRVTKPDHNAVTDACIDALTAVLMQSLTAVLIHPRCDRMTATALLPGTVHHFHVVRGVDTAGKGTAKPIHRAPPPKLYFLL